MIGLIHGYRDRGHTLSTTNPIKPRKDRKPHLDLSDYDLSEADLDSHFAAGFELNMTNATLRDIIGRLLPDLLRQYRFRKHARVRQGKTRVAAPQN